MSKTKELPSIEYLLECFNYDKENGKLYWKERPRSHFNDQGNFIKFNKNIAGKEARTVDKSIKGFLLAKLDKSVYKIHRIIWKLEYNEDVTDNLEHIDGNVKNNKISNLRKYTPAWEHKKEKLISNTGNNRVISEETENDSIFVLELPSQEYLKECFDYNPNTGILTWKERPLYHFSSETNMKITNTRFIGKRAGSNNRSDGYNKIHIDSKHYATHRIIWKWYYGEDPSCVIDHINGIKDDNRICNLRDVTRSENGVNRVNLAKNNTTGHTGVYYCKHHKKISSKGSYR